MQNCMLAPKKICTVSVINGQCLKKFLLHKIANNAIFAKFIMYTGAFYRILCYTTLLHVSLWYSMAFYVILCICTAIVAGRSGSFWSDTVFSVSGLLGFVLGSLVFRILFFFLWLTLELGGTKLSWVEKNFLKKSLGFVTNLRTPSNTPQDFSQTSGTHETYG